MATTFTTITPTLVPTTSNELFKNELEIGIGITLLGALIGLGYGLYKNNQAKAAGGAVQSDAWAAFEGALVGLIIALIAVLIYRVYFHARAAYTMGQIQHLQQQQQIAQLQGYRQQGLANKPQPAQQYYKQ